jgi:tripartite-type tricarboxylate transporter receptor subunit TctC
MSSRTVRLAGIAAGIFAMAAFALPVAAQSVADFYKGKRLSIYVGSTTGGGYDAYARHVARHIGRLLPGAPETVVMNMPGGGGLKVTNFLYSVAPKDGTAFGTLQRNMLTAPLLEARTENNAFEPQKFNWLGSLNTETGVIISSTTAPHKTMDDLFKTELIVGSSGPATDFLPLFLNNVIGTKFKIVQGYQSSTEAYLALERGEVQGRVSGGWTGDRKTVEPWHAAGKVRYLAVVSLKASAYFPGLPLVTDYAKTDEQKQVMELILSSQLWGRPFTMPPGVPSDRVAAMRKAFVDLTKDAAFVAEAEKLQLDLELVDGPEIDAIMARVYAAPLAVVDIARKAIGADVK